MSLIHDLWDEFQRLTAAQKRVVFEMYWNGYTEAETAETMGISERTVRRALASAENKLRNSLGAVSGFTATQAFIEVKDKNEGAARGNGQRPDKSKAPASLGPPASFCPPPDIYLGSPARDAFIKELSWIAASPFLQLQGRGNYAERARMNRERIARDRERERAERMAAIAA